MTFTSFGASVGRGPVYSATVEMEDGRIVEQQVRAIDPGAYGIDSLRRRGDLLNSGFDLLSQQRDTPFDAVGVVTHNRRGLLAVRFGSRGALRGADVVRESDALLRALDQRGVIARFDRALVVDLGAAGTRVHSVVGSRIVAESAASSLSFTAAEPSVDTIDAAVDFVRTCLTGGVQALTLVGVGAQHDQVRRELESLADDAGADVVAVDEPEALGAIGAALLAADRGAAGAKPAALAGGRFGAFAGRSVGLTAAVFPILALAILTVGVLAATYATGAIWTSSETDEPAPTTSNRQLSEGASYPGEGPVAISSSTLPPQTSTVPVPTQTAVVPGPLVPPTMTTFAPVPAPTTSTRPRSTTTTPTTTPQTTTTAPKTTPSTSPHPSSGATAPSSTAPSNGGTSRVPGASELVPPPSTSGTPAQSGAPTPDRGHAVAPSSPAASGPAVTTTPTGVPAVTVPAP